MYNTSNISTNFKAQFEPLKRFVVEGGKNLQKFINVKRGKIEQEPIYFSSHCRFCKTLFNANSIYRLGLSQCDTCYDNAGGGFYFIRTEYIFKTVAGYRTEQKLFWIPYNIYRTRFVQTEKYSPKISKNFIIKTTIQYVKSKAEEINREDILKTPMEIAIQEVCMLEKDGICKTIMIFDKIDFIKHSDLMVDISSPKRYSNPLNA